MKSTLWWLGVIFGALSILKLIESGFDYGFGLTLGAALGLYEQFLQALIDLRLPWWSEPVVQQLVSLIHSWVGIDFALYPHWKHVFVLMFLYLGATARTASEAGRWVFAAFVLVWGLVVAFLSSVAAGAIELAPSAYGAAGQGAFTVVPIAGYVLFELVKHFVGPAITREHGETYFQSLQAFARHPHLRAAVAGLAMMVAMVPERVPWINTLPNPGLAILGTLVGVLAGYWVLRGLYETRQAVVYARSRIRSRESERNREYQPSRELDVEPNDEREIGPVEWLEALSVSGSFRLGIRMFGSLGLAALLVLANAGLKLAGL